MKKISISIDRCISRRRTKINCKVSSIKERFPCRRPTPVQLLLLLYITNVSYVRRFLSQATTGTMVFVSICRSHRVTRVIVIIFSLYKFLVTMFIWLLGRLALCINDDDAFKTSYLKMSQLPHA